MTRRLLLQSGIALANGGSAAGDRTAEMAEYARRIFQRANELRVASGVGALEWWDPLGRCAEQQSARKEKLRFPGHDDPERGNVSQRVNAAGITWDRCGENLFSERGFEDPVHLAIVFWWYSPGHKENMLNPDYTRTGVGVVQGPDEMYFVTQIFLRPRTGK